MTMVVGIAVLYIGAILLGKRVDTVRFSPAMVIILIALLQLSVALYAIFTMEVPTK